MGEREGEGRRAAKKRTSSSISKRVKPPYLGDDGRAGGGEDVEVGGFGAGDTIAAINVELMRSVGVVRLVVQ